MARCSTKLSLEKIAEALEILSQPLRLQIVCMLSKADKVCVCEMVEKFWLKQNLISHHLGMLKRIWIVDTERQGVNIFYSLNKQVYEDFKSSLKNIFSM